MTSLVDGNSDLDTVPDGDVLDRKQFGEFFGHVRYSTARRYRYDTMALPPTSVVSYNVYYF